MSEFRFGLRVAAGDIALAADAGFDYVELDVKEILSMDVDAYRSMAAVMEKKGIYAEVLCGMLPDDVSAVGASVSASRIHETLKYGFEAAKALGASLAVFDREEFRRPGAGADPAVSWRQLGNTMRMVQAYAADNGIRAAFMPVRRGSGALINHIAEALMIPSVLGLDRVGVAADRYHMAMESEPVRSLKDAGSLLWHVRVSNALGNKMPAAGDGEDYEGILKTLSGMGYTGRVTCEGSCTDLKKDAAAALERMKKAAELCGGS